MSVIDSNSKICIECKRNVVHFHRSYFCKSCIRGFFNKNKAERGLVLPNHKRALSA